MAEIELAIFTDPDSGTHATLVAKLEGQIQLLEHEVRVAEAERELKKSELERARQAAQQSRQPDGVAAFRRGMDRDQRQLDFNEAETQCSKKANELLQAKRVERPEGFIEDEHFGQFAKDVIADREFVRPEPIDYRTWGSEIDKASHAQMKQACSVPMAAGAALMPDAHVGYGLPIGGVLALEGAVIPYAVGVDIAYAAANHDVIHRFVTKLLGAQIIAGVENHHNFAWKEVHGGRELIVHRKGATPAGEGVLGVIPGSMASPAFVVRGLGNEDSLNSASHGAGRRMSRKKAKDKYNWKVVQKDLENKGVQVLSAGADEVPGVYKDIEDVMREQADLVEIVARFDPKIVKMCDDGSKAED